MNWSLLDAIVEAGWKFNEMMICVEKKLILDIAAKFPTKVGVQIFNSM